MEIRKGVSDYNHQHWAMSAARREGSMVSLSREAVSRNSCSINGGICSSKAATSVCAAFICQSGWKSIA